jgi:hypothetical protein
VLLLSPCSRRTVSFSDPLTTVLGPSLGSEAAHLPWASRVSSQHPSYHLRAPLQLYDYAEGEAGEELVEEISRCLPASEATLCRITELCLFALASCRHRLQQRHQCKLWLQLQLTRLAAPLRAQWMGSPLSSQPTALTSTITSTSGGCAAVGVLAEAAVAVHVNHVD